MKLHVQNQLISDLVKVYLIDQHLERRFSVRVEESSHCSMTALEGKGEELPPFFTMQNKMFENFVKEILKYAQENDIKPEKETALQARLEVTEERLSDMKKYWEEAWTQIKKRI